MAELIGLLASVASLIALTSKTAKACHKLAESIASFKNAQKDIQKISVELLDLAQILELIEAVLMPLQKDKAGVQGHLELVERSLARIKKGVQEIADNVLAARPTARGRSTKYRAKWMYNKSDIASMIVIIDKQKQGLLLQFNLLNTKFAHSAHAELRDVRKCLEQVSPQIEDLTASITTSISESNLHLKTAVQASATSLQSSIKDEIHQTVLSIPRESNIPQASIETLSVLVSNIVASRFESPESETSLTYSGSRLCTQFESAQRPPNEPQTEDVGTTTMGSQAVIDDLCNGKPGHFDHDEGSSKLISRTSVWTMTSILGTVVIRRSTVREVYLNSDQELFSDDVRLAIDFLPASWLQYWTRCGIFLARMGFGNQTVDISFTGARILDFRSDRDTRKALRAVKKGDIRKLIGFLQRKVIYPTDRDVMGRSLLSIAAVSGQLEICELLLQQGAAVDINTPSFLDRDYPIESAILASVARKDHDFVRLFLKHGAEITIDKKGFSFALLPLIHWCDAIQETSKLLKMEKQIQVIYTLTGESLGSLFRFLVQNDPSIDIDERYIGGKTLFMESFGQPRQIFEEMIKLGADVKAVDDDGGTVLHGFLKRMTEAHPRSFPAEALLDGGKILASLSQAEAGPLVNDWMRDWPQGVRHTSKSFPLRRVEERIYLAFWHQALRTCGLSGSKFCHCPIHHRIKVYSTFPSRRRRLDRSVPGDTFEEEMSAALRRWDKSVAQESPPSVANVVTIEEQEEWNNQCDRIDKWIQQVLVELRARQIKVFSEGNVKASISVEDSSNGRTESKFFRSDDMHPSDHPNMFLTPSDQDWETGCGSSSNSEEEWELAPET